MRHVRKIDILATNFVLGDGILACFSSRGFRAGVRFGGPGEGGRGVVAMVGETRFRNEKRRNP